MKVLKARLESSACYFILVNRVKWIIAHSVTLLDEKSMPFSVDNAGFS